MAKNQIDEEKKSTPETINELLEERTELSIKCLQLEKKLDIAVKALELYQQKNWDYEDEYIGTPCKTCGWVHAEKALKIIKELK